MLRMSEGEKPKLTGIAAVGAAFAAIMMKGGMACGSAISHLAKPASHVAEEAAHVAGHIPSGAVKAAEEGGAALVEDAGKAAARRATHMSDTTDRIVDSGTTLARGEIRRRARDEREKKRKEEEKKRAAQESKK